MGNRERIAVPSRPPSFGRSPDRRASAARRGYDREWEEIRADQIAWEPWCQRCGAPASHADHIRPRRQFANRAAADLPNNLQSLCASCHSSKTASGL